MRGYRPHLKSESSRLPCAFTSSVGGVSVGQAKYTGSVAVLSLDTSWNTDLTNGPA